ncbi:MAG: hypothetical protein KZQ74_01215 [gamma proteobacterium symbiont of Bathyaustriella thionipta]|nr:hypothetical protein [gamma proteobacterium symbiont of Bathyaustriella thionipta]MCU7951746.1 hypothetical protein [gamma proteobacterium symbiont of Bathyaustriella thionipta]MCU7958349.1 hypothetical protein [gamma proteobacterium symbiont of Bathyaustriella thionipta]MCU7965827.1 hypothetical protein [gamma proteobacterium symbiont of Bathyaustriella thionipta]
MKNLTIILFITFLLSGCSTNPYNTSTNSKGMEITKSAAIGAVGGAVTGVVIGDSRKSTLIGAGLGALIMGVSKAYQEYSE